MEQPFSTQRVARSEYFTDRARELDRVLEAMRTRDRLVLYGERRMGKSSIIARAAERIESEGGVVLTADAWAIDGLDDINRALMRSVPADWLVGDRVAGVLKALRSIVTVSVNEAGQPVLQFSGAAAPDMNPTDRLGRILRGLDEIAEDREHPVVVVIDEFQRMEDLQTGSGGLLRNTVQETPNLAYILAGSVVGLVVSLLGPSGPFHAIDRLEIKAIDHDHLISWIQHRLESHGVEITEEGARSIYEMGGPVTEYVIRLAKVVYRKGRDPGSVSVGLVESAFDEVVSDHTGSFEVIWDTLSPAKRQVLRAVADGKQQLNSKDVMERYGISTSSAATYAINELRHDALLAPRKPHRVSDPFFAEWIRRHA